MCYFKQNVYNLCDFERNDKERMEDVYAGQFTILNAEDGNAAVYSCSPSEEETPCC